MPTNDCFVESHNGAARTPVQFKMEIELEKLILISVYKVKMIV